MLVEVCRPHTEGGRKHRKERKEIRKEEWARQGRKEGRKEARKVMKAGEGRRCL